MKNILQFLPLNRKEKYWTSCVLPQIITGLHFSDLHHFLDLIKVPSSFIKQKYSNNEIGFFTEYCLRDSALDWNKEINITGETPDITILLINGDERFLIFVEAKMFDTVNSSKIRNQLNNQKKIAKIILDKGNISHNNFTHVVLFLKPPTDLKLKKDETLIHWENIVNTYISKSGNYFYEILKIASKSYHLMSKGVATFGNNKTGNMVFNEIVNHFNNYGDFFVGRNKGIATIVQDCNNRRVYNFKYEVNTDLNPNIHNPPGKTGRNWFSAKEFIEVLKSHGIIN